ncbi:hypothetical protein GCM10023350_34930 [Nocardioides endophyticus]|uniref:Uncharacterized protein n=1 Tax=Nocardioides endophyticus TaxID=1353775 RepID=A0ABP8Z5D4_9ACTN
MDETVDDTTRALQAAQVILDGVTEPAPGGGVVGDAMQLAFGRLVEEGAIELAVEAPDEDDEDGEFEVELDIAPLLGGISLVVDHLVDELTRRGGMSREDVIATAREALAR